jgi:hypothetical protein
MTTYMTIGHVETIERAGRHLLVFLEQLGQELILLHRIVVLVRVEQRAEEHVVVVAAVVVIVVDGGFVLLVLLFGVVRVARVVEKVLVGRRER